MKTAGIVPYKKNPWIHIVTEAGITQNEKAIKGTEDMVQNNH